MCEARGQALHETVGLLLAELFLQDASVVEFVLVLDCLFNPAETKLNVRELQGLQI